MKAFAAVVGMLVAAKTASKIVGHHRHQAEAKQVRSARNQLAIAMIVAEYNSLKAEVIYALNAAQGVMKWSLSGFGVMFTAGWAVVYQYIDGGTKSVLLGYLSPLIFGGAAPGLIIVGAWTWLGELSRMERVATRLRAIEQRVARESQVREVINAAPAVEETFIAQAWQRTKIPKQTEKQVKSPLEYLATAGWYFLGMVISLCATVLILLAIPSPIPADRFWIAWVIVPVPMVVFLGSCFWLMRRFYGLHNQSAPDMYEAFGEYMATS